MDNLLVEVRFVEDDTRQSPGRLVGTLITYGEPAADRPEVIDRGAFYWGERGIVINEQHNRQAPIMRLTPYLDGDALNIDAPLPNTQRGRDAAIMVSDGTLSGLSVEMARGSVKARMLNGVRHITSAELVAAGLVDIAAYQGSTVEVRGRRRSSVRALYLL